MNLQEWIEKNRGVVDWSLFDEPWDAMQLTHNPFRTEQIDAILAASRLLQKRTGTVLDLGCGPGVLGRQILNQRPHLHYIGADGDPLMLAAVGELVSVPNVRTMLVDLRKTEWAEGLTPQFDSVVSLTALHWLSQPHQRALYGAVYQILKPGGTFVVGDPYAPEDPEERKEFDPLEELAKQNEGGQTWEEFWKGFFTRYPIRQLYADYHKDKGYQEPCEGTDDGYPLSFQLNALREAGFGKPAIFWKKGLRVVYGGMKYDS